MTAFLHNMPGRVGWAPYSVDVAAPDVTDEWGFRLASIADGEGHFGITRTGRSLGSWRCFFVVGLRADDLPFLEMCRDACGLGRVHITKRYVSEARPNANPLAKWDVARVEQVYSLVRLFEKYPLLSKKAQDFAIWHEACRQWSWGEWERMAELYQELRACRVYRGFAA